MSEPSAGAMQRITTAMNILVRRYMPDPFVLAVILLALVFVAGVALTPTTPSEMVTHFGTGVWSLLGFAMQLSLVVVTGSTLGETPVIKRGVHRLAAIPSSPTGAVVFVTLLTAAIALVNWGVGLVVGVICAREVARRIEGAHFPLLIAATYAGYTLWSAGMSSSIPLTLNTPGHPLEAMTGLIPITQTLLSPWNLILAAALLITHVLTARAMVPARNQATGLPEAAANETETVAAPTATEGSTPAEWLERSRILSIGAGLLGLVFVLRALWDGGLNALNLNALNLLVLSLGLILSPGLLSYLRSAERTATSVLPILIIYPFYAAVATMITASGLGDLVTQGLARVASAETLPLITFLTAGLINIVIPADGGHLVLQGPIFFALADQQGVPVGLVTTAMTIGANWTNLLQPFWALPLLALAGLGIRDIMGYCLILLVTSGIVASVVLLAFGQVL